MFYREARQGTHWSQAEGLVLEGGVMGTENYDVICLSCSTQVGEIFNGRFVQYPSRRDLQRPVRAAPRMPRRNSPDECGSTLLPLRRLAIP
jgi:hypothetical protein